MNEALALWLMAPEAPDGPLTLEDFLHRPEWHREALCRGEGVAMFVRAPKADYGRLRAVCGACPVRQECLASAFEFGAERFVVGIWGGTTGRSRKGLRRGVA
jgi:WhiB family transcriptional regulator, redox-sensing transcriptional regulator